MNYKIEDMIKYMEDEGSLKLGEGDLIMTGTPEGIDVVREGDVLEATMRHPGGEVISTIRQKIGREAEPFV